MNGNGIECRSAGELPFAPFPAGQTSLAAALTAEDP